MITTMRHAQVTACAVLLVALVGSPAARAGTAYLEVTHKLDRRDRPAAVEIYRKYRKPFLDEIPGAKSMLIRQHDVQVLHGFATARQAEAYLSSDLFTKGVVTALKPLLKADPEVRIYSTP